MAKTTGKKDKSDKAPRDYALQSVGVIGAGAWGTALAQTVRRAGRDVVIWAHEIETVEDINANHANRVYLPGVSLDPSIRATVRGADAAACDVLLLVAPSPFMRQVATEIAPHVSERKPVVICAKGFEEEREQLMSDLVAEVLPQADTAVLSGPSFASEVARGLPAALTLAARDEALGLALIQALGSRSFRLYWTDDVIGAQVGGAVKNVLAIAAGVVDGRKFGANAHAAITTRGFAELARFGAAMGARPETLTGLSGLGDLLLTCSSPQSRNMSLGQALGEGRSLEEVLGGRKSVSEGVHTVRAVVAMAQKLDVEMPICEAVLAILTGAASVDDAIDAVLSRPLRAESDRAAGKKA
ncbi:MAG: NAD(P)H-dependent glycerol-3-phosphate dehydrogenase [Hyphomicrobiales bacterium]|nr:NAD(P)H-dependent glycerol-3-phosphate dehydrogenase [Hyphomicrobiales bacterium]